MERNEMIERISVSNDREYHQLRKGIRESTTMQKKGSSMNLKKNRLF